MESADLVVIGAGKSFDSACCHSLRELQLVSEIVWSNLLISIDCFGNIRLAAWIDSRKLEREECLERFADSAWTVLARPGWHGLVAAKTYAEVNPAAEVVLLEAAASIGGTWAKHRLYPGLKSNNMLGTFEYSDFPMGEPSFGVKPGEHVPGPVVHDYLHKYAEEFHIYVRIRFESKVETVERHEDGSWLITTVLQSTNSVKSEADGGRRKKLLAQRLIVATGLTSEPFLPDFAGSEIFGLPFFHCVGLPDHVDSLLRTATSVAILGCSKFAWDTAYVFASAGIKVNWIIRASGHGPVWMTPPYVTPFKLWLEKLVSTRCLTWFSPCIWGDSDGFGRIRSFLHGTKVGRWIVDRFWGVMTDDVVNLTGYDKHPETKKLKPWTDTFWAGTSLSILNYPTEILEYVRNGAIKIHITDITHLSSKTVHLSTGESVITDALICSTGWKARPSITFLPPGIDAQLGLPHTSSAPEQDVVQKADDEILDRLPRLRSGPALNPHYKLMTGGDKSISISSPSRPYRLYRFMVPPAFIEERTIAFCGMVQSTQTAVFSQIQALWITAFLDGKLLSLDQHRRQESSLAGRSLQEQVEWETILHNQFAKRRFPPSAAHKFPEVTFDCLPYMDLLLQDLGLQHRRKKGLPAECFQPYGASDYCGLVDEWKAKMR